MKLFRKRPAELSGRQQAIAEQIAGRILVWQRRSADYLNDKSSELSIRTWRIMLLGFCLVFGFYCGYLLLQGF